MFCPLKMNLLDYYTCKLAVCTMESEVFRLRNKKLIRRRDSERELSLRQHCTRTTKYNRLVHKFCHRSTRLCHIMCWNAGLPNSVK